MRKTKNHYEKRAVLHGATAIEAARGKWGRVLSMVSIEGQQQVRCYFETVLVVGLALKGEACSYWSLCGMTAPNEAAKHCGSAN